jgi:hypothetical protein
MGLGMSVSDTYGETKMAPAINATGAISRFTGKASAPRF